MQIRLQKIILTVILLLAFPVMRIYAGEVQEDRIRVGYYENELFEEGAEENAVKTGYAYEYYRKISEYTGWRYEYVYGSFNDLYDSLLKGDIDLIAGLAIREDRIGRIGYPQMAMGTETYILLKHQNDERITADPGTLSGKKIGVLKSAIVDVLNEYLQSHDVKADVITFEDYESLFEAFDLGNIEVLAAEGDGAYGREYSEVLGHFGSSDYYLCVNIKRQDLLEDLDRAQAELNADEPNYISSLQSKYYSASVQSRTFSADEKNWMEEHDSLTVGYLNNYLPYSDTDAEGNVNGIVKDIIPSIFKNMKVGFDITYIGYDRYDDMISDTASGTLDVAFPVGGGFYYSEESGINQSSAVTSAATDLIFAGEYDDTTTSDFAVNDNNRMQYYFITTNFPDAKITFYPSIDDCLKAVQSGEVKATTLNGLRANDILKNSRYNGLFLRQLGIADDRCFGVGIGDDGLLKLLNRGINVIGTDHIQNLAYRYAGELYSYTFVDMLRDHLWIFMGMILFIAVLFILLVFKELNYSKRASRLKSDFVSSMSREIRTPITRIMDMNGLIQKESKDWEIRQYSDNIEKAGETLLGMISNILDYSLIEAGTMEIHNEAYRLVELLSGIESAIAQKAAKKGLAFEMDIDKKLPAVPEGDVEKLNQMITGILANSVNCTESGSVKLTMKLISISEKNFQMEVLIEDTRPAKEKEELERIMNDFSRPLPERNPGIDSPEITLAIITHMLELMKSRITVTTGSEGSTCFSFKLTQRISDGTPLGDYRKTLKQF